MLAGGVRSAIDAGIPETIIMEFGRWKSIAWRHYLVHSCVDLRGRTAFHVPTPQCLNYSPRVEKCLLCALCCQTAGASAKMWQKATEVHGAAEVRLRAGGAWGSAPPFRAEDQVAAEFIHSSTEVSASAGLLARTASLFSRWG